MLQRRPTPLGKWFAGGLGNLEKGFLRATKRAHLPGVTFHCLRHTYASYGVMSGVDLYTMSRLLGHRSVKMTERYAHLAPAHLQQAAIQTAKAIFAADVPHQVPQAPRVTAQIIEFPGEKAAVA